MIWDLVLKGAIVLASNIIGAGEIPSALHLATKLIDVANKSDPQTEAKNGWADILSTAVTAIAVISALV
jgi:hypothetical protein